MTHAASPEQVEIDGVGIAPHGVLDLKRQAVQAMAHVCGARRQPTAARPKDSGSSPLQRRDNPGQSLGVDIRPDDDPSSLGRAHLARNPSHSSV